MRMTKHTWMILAACCMGVGLLLSLCTMATVDFDLRRISASGEYETRTFETEDFFQNIDVRIISSDVVLLPAKNDICRIEYLANEILSVDIQIINDTLTIQQTDTRQWWEHIGFFWGGIGYGQEDMKIYLPKDVYSTLYIKTISGTIRIPDTLTFADAELYSTSGEIQSMAYLQNGLTAKTTSGDIDVSHIIGGNLIISSTSGDLEIIGAAIENTDLHTTSGDISADDMTASAHTEITSTSGDVHIRKMSSSTCTVQTTSGDIRFENTDIADHMYLKSTSGEIRLEGCDAPDMEIATVSGDVEGTLRTPKRFVTKTTSGNVSVPYDEETNGKCSIKTTSGDIRFRIR